MSGNSVLEAVQIIGSNTEFVAGITGAVLGAFVSGLIALLLQRREHRREECERNRERKEQRKAMAHGLIIKMMMIRSYTKKLAIKLDEVDSVVGINKRFPNPWQAYQRIVHKLPDIAFSPEEIQVLNSLQENKLFYDVVTYDQTYGTILELIAQLNEKKAVILNLLPAQMNGISGQFSADQELWSHVGPKAAEFDDLFLQTISMCREERQRSKRLMLQLRVALQERTGLTIDLPEMEEVSGSKN